jgi:hypothetical protein
LTDGHIKSVLIEMVALLIIMDIDNMVGQFYIAYHVNTTKEGREILRNLEDDETPEFKKCQIPIHNTTYVVAKKWIHTGFIFIFLNAFIEMFGLFQKPSGPFDKANLWTLVKEIEKHFNYNIYDDGIKRFGRYWSALAPFSLTLIELAVRWAGAFGDQDESNNDTCP